MEDYKPVYSTKDICVKLKDDSPIGMEEWFSKKFGYEIIEGNMLREPDWVIYRVGEGNVEESLKKFLEYKEFIEWVEKRDLKFEKRWGFVENLEEKIADIGSEHVEKGFLEKLLEIKKEIETYDEKIEEN